jgi:hypothetical protein
LLEKNSKNILKEEQMKTKLLSIVVGAACAALMASAASAMVVTQTTNVADLAAALGGNNLTINSVAINNGAADQFGTYTGFTSAPVTIGAGVVLSSGLATQTTAAFHSIDSLPDNIMGVSGTAEFNAYGPGHITNFFSSNDVAALQVNFTLSTASQVGFDFIFGSVEYPIWTNAFTDAFVAFLDGTAPTDQIVFDASNNAVQVGTSFASALTTADTNSAFSNPHGLVKLQTFTGTLAAGDHSLIFEVADVNDQRLDSAVFLSNFHAGQGTQGTGTGEVPEPSTMLLLGAGLAGTAIFGRKLRKS